jgi:hypothetical protein
VTVAAVVVVVGVAAVYSGELIPALAFIYQARFRIVVRDLAL